MGRRVKVAILTAVLVLGAGCAQGSDRGRIVEAGTGDEPAGLPDEPGGSGGSGEPEGSEVPGGDPLPGSPGLSDVRPGPGAPTDPLRWRPLAPAAPETTTPEPLAEREERSASVAATDSAECATLTMYALAAPGGAPAGGAPGEGGSVWFTDPATSSVGRLARDGSVTRYRLRDGARPGAIARGPNGDVWFVDASGPSIGRITPQGVVTEFPLPTVEQNPMGGPGQGSLPMSITAGGDGAMWFVEAGADQVGRITAGGEISEFPLPRRERMHAHPTAIATGRDGGVWFSEPLLSILARIDVETHAITEFAMRPRGEGGGGLVGGNSLTTGPDGTLWYESGAGMAAMSTSGDLEAIVLPNPLWRPAAVAAGSDGSLWFLETLDGKVIRMSPERRFTEWAAPAEAAGIGHGSPRQTAVGPAGELWFTAPAGNRIGLVACASGAP